MRFDLGWEAEIGRAEARPSVVVPRSAPKAKQDMLAHVLLCPCHARGVGVSELNLF